MQKILVIEDDDTINRLLFDLLKDRYDVTQAYAGTEGKRLLESESFDLLLLDLMLPGVSGEELISTIREQSSVPIIVITAKAEVNVLANVLKIGANDYIAKPFNAIEVLARVEARLRSTDSQVVSQQLSLEDIHMNEESHQVIINKQEVSFTQKEYELLKCFLEHPKKVFTKANLYETVWNVPFLGDDNTVTVHVSRLRNKVNQYSQKEWLQTVWGVGFKFQK